MNPAVESRTTLAENQKAALISLLADEDQAIYRIVREKLISFGPVVSQWLSAYRLSNDPLLRRRAQAIIDYFTLQRTDREFLAFCFTQGEQFDLEKGAFMLARTQYPSVNMEAYGALLDSFAAELRTRLDLHGPAFSILNRINEYLFDELKFSGSEENYYDPQNSYLNRVLDRRRGNPISLCLVYLLIASRLHLPMVGIGLPGHFLCRFQTLRDELYVDAFNHGNLLTKGDCIKYLLQIHHQLDESYLGPMTHRRILLRICANLHQIYTQSNKVAEGERFQHYLIALAK